MNATVQSLQWLLHISGQGMDQMGAGGHFFQTLRDAGNYVDLMQVQQWREIVAGWAEVHRQHDIGEFMGYMLTRMRPPIFRGDGKPDVLRTMEGQLAVLIRGMEPRHYCLVYHPGLLD